MGSVGFFTNEMTARRGQHSFIKGALGPVGWPAPFAKKLLAERRGQHGFIKEALGPVGWPAPFAKKLLAERRGQHGFIKGALGPVGWPAPFAKKNYQRSDVGSAEAVRRQCGGSAEATGGQEIY